MAIIRTYKNTKYGTDDSIVGFKKMAELTYFAVPASSDYDCDVWVSFTDEDAACAFAESIGKSVYTDYHFVTIK